jgi:dihydropteroate synthase
MDGAKNTIKLPIAVWNCRGRLVVVDKPMVMGILNVTPDSFYAGSRTGTDSIVERAGVMIDEGADILDVGGQSTRPGSERISAEVEIQRVIPMIRALQAAYPTVLLSIDTYHHEVAAAAVEAGAGMVNDISAGDMDAMMIPTVAALQVPYVIMHMKGNPGTMQELAVYDDVILEVMDHFILKTMVCRKAGIRDLVIDPGFGFAKTMEHNLTLLNKLAAFQIFDLPIMAGLSRKSTISRILGTDAEHALNGTTVMNTVALLNGATILRVHDVREAKEAVLLTRAMMGNRP